MEDLYDHMHIELIDAMWQLGIGYYFEINDGHCELKKESCE